jgi:hypothetical protein
MPLQAEEGGGAVLESPLATPALIMAMNVTATTSKFWKLATNDVNQMRCYLQGGRKAFVKAAA